MPWNDVYATSSKGAQKRGINWEPLNQATRCGKRVCTVRITLHCRARVIGDGEHMRMLSLHPDHDSAYEHPGGDG
jgi:hypothetical protein